MNDTYTAATGFWGEACDIQSKEKRHRTFSNLILKGKLCEAVIFFYTWEKCGAFQPEELADDITGIINETVTSVVAGKHLNKTNPSCSTLET